MLAFPRNSFHCTIDSRDCLAAPASISVMRELSFVGPPAGAWLGTAIFL